MVYLKQVGWREVTHCTSAWSIQAKHGCHEQVAMQKHKRGSRHNRQEQAQRQAIRQTLLLMRLQAETCLRWTRQLLNQLSCRYALHATFPHADKEVKTTVVQRPSKGRSHLTFPSITYYCIALCFSGVKSYPVLLVQVKFCCLDHCACFAFLAKALLQ